MEELTENAEEPDEGESKESVQKLGKLQYKVFETHTNTSNLLNPPISFRTHI